MLSSKTAIITGGSRGIGKAISLSMAKNNANVAIIYAGNTDAANEVCEKAQQYGVKAKAYCCDVADFEVTKEIVQKIIEDFGSVDILVNNAGIVRDKLMLSMSENDYDVVLDTNLKGSFNMIKHLYSHFAKKRSGSIINITSVSGMMGNAGQCNYSAAKAGMIGLTKSVAKELAARGVTCNAIAPGFIETDMTNELSDKVKEAAINQIPMKKMGTPDDIANMASFLASENARYITGETIKIDGGLYM